MSDVSDSHLKLGRRVECRKNGPYNGKRGNVEDFMGDYQIAVVSFDDGSTLVDSASFFEPV